MEEYKILIITIMFVCIIAIYIWIKLVERKIHLNEIKQFEQFRGKRDLILSKAYEDKGIYGEFKVFKIFNKYFGENAKIFNSVYLPKENNKVTEVDLIAINEKSIFVVEVKNLYGIITGNKEDKYWNQQLNDSLVEELYNPIIQNQNHIKYFKKNLDLARYNLSDKNIYSLIVFGEKSNINSVRYNESNIKIINISELENTLDQIIGDNPIILKQTQIEEISSIIKKFEDVDSQVIENHINDILEYY
ncbi:nuclease-related domain-containing protein [Paraclostridium sordellii]|uniref:nuclease-related domain-containing protein n=1 Tax=Paraclostridium sordellii TaxID=1505 RepID=UPI0005E1B2C4|nr:nuclease-related domain-containing protein [Paeniclostridium sordellii]CEN77904.1 NERD domain-containing protein [[Clostridium] sordellii] [Paeniclostridium sordellii]